MLTPRRLWPLILLVCSRWSPTVTIGGTLAPQTPAWWFPLDGQPVAGASCVPMIGEITQHPNWSLGVAEREYSCMGYEDLGAYELHDDGRVQYDADGITRWLALTGDELARLRTLDALSCDFEPPHYGGRSVILSAGVPSYEYGVHISTVSELGEALYGMIGAAEARYFAARAAELEGARRVVRIDRRERITIDGLRLRAWRGRRVVDRQALSPEEQVRVIEALDQGVSPDDRRAPMALRNARWALFRT